MVLLRLPEGAWCLNVPMHGVAIVKLIASIDIHFRVESGQLALAKIKVVVPKKVFFEILREIARFQARSRCLSIVAEAKKPVRIEGGDTSGRFYCEACQKPWCLEWVSLCSAWTLGQGCAGKSFVFESTVRL